VNSPPLEGVSSLNSAVERTKTIRSYKRKILTRRDEIIILENKRMRKKRRPLR